MNSARIAVFLLLASAIPCSADVTWLTFKDPNGAFTVDVDGTPTVDPSPIKDESGKEWKNVTYTVNHSSSAMVVCDTDFGSMKNASSGAAIDGGVKNIKANKDNQVTSESLVQLDGQIGREVIILDKDRNRLTDRLFFVANHLYQLMTVAMPSSNPQEVADSQKFQQSFHFVGK